jgi:hypothetical protein
MRNSGLKKGDAEKCAGKLERARERTPDGCNSLVSNRVDGVGQKWAFTIVHLVCPHAYHLRSYSLARKKREEEGT